MKHNNTTKYNICVKRARPVDDLELDLILRYLAVEVLLPPVLGQQHL